MECNYAKNKNFKYLIIILYGFFTCKSNNDPEDFIHQKTKKKATIKNDSGIISNKQNLKNKNIHKNGQVHTKTDQNVKPLDKITNRNITETNNKKNISKNENLTQINKTKENSINSDSLAKSKNKDISLVENFLSDNAIQNLENKLKKELRIEKLEFPEKLKKQAEEEVNFDALYYLFCHPKYNYLFDQSEKDPNKFIEKEIKKYTSNQKLVPGLNLEVVCHNCNKRSFINVGIEYDLDDLGGKMTYFNIPEVMIKYMSCKNCHKQIPASNLIKFVFYKCTYYIVLRSFSLTNPQEIKQKAFFLKNYTWDRKTTYISGIIYIESLFKNVRLKEDLSESYVETLENKIKDELKVDKLEFPEKLKKQAEEEANFDALYYLFCHPKYNFLFDQSETNPNKFIEKEIKKTIPDDKLVKGLNIEAFCNNCNKYCIVNIGSKHGYDDSGNKMNCFIMGEIIHNLFCTHCKIQIIRPIIRHLLFYRCKYLMRMYEQGQSSHDPEIINNQAIFLKGYKFNRVFISFTIKILECF